MEKPLLSEVLQAAQAMCGDLAKKLHSKKVCLCDLNMYLNFNSIEFYSKIYYNTSIKIDQCIEKYYLYEQKGQIWTEVDLHVEWMFSYPGQHLTVV